MTSGTHEVGEKLIKGFGKNTLRKEKPKSPRHRRGQYLIDVKEMIWKFVHWVYLKLAVSCGVNP